MWQYGMASVRYHVLATSRYNDPHADWLKLNSSLYSVTFLAHQNGHGKTCLRCLESDHLGSECALAPAIAYKTSKPTTRDDNRPGKVRPDRRECNYRVCSSWNDWCCAVPYYHYKRVLYAKASVWCRSVPLTCTG